jgi:ribosomal protein L11 methyltransferase
VKDYPAIEVRTSAPDLLLAIVDDYGATAVEEIEGAGTVRIFFGSPAARDTARRALADRFEVTPIEVSDEDWARRSQDNLQPVTVGCITLVPNPQFLANPESRIPNPESRAANPESPIPNHFTLVVQPSMGFGTGHHATTRLCLAALQAIDLENKIVLDVGTGSGVLALAAERLGAARAVGLDDDPDAIQSANENLELNPAVTRVTFEVVDISASALPEVDVITANLTGALLVRSAAMLLGAVRSGGLLILSGLLRHERNDVCRAFAPATVVSEREEDGWVGLTVKKP